MSAGVEWSLHCCITLSQATAPVPTVRLAELHDVSRTYLAKHLQALARAGLIRSTEGRDGGYLLTRAAEEISVLDVVEAVEGTDPAFRCTELRQRGPLAATARACVSPCAIASAMAAAEAAWRTALAPVSIADLAGQVDQVTAGTAFPRLREWLVQ